METIKKTLAVVPIPVWIIIVLLALVGFYWMSDDIGSWREGRKQDKFDQSEIKRNQEIDALVKQRDEAINRAVAAEAREQGKIIEADLLRQEASKRGINIDAAQKKIDTAVTDYASDQAIIDKVKTGEISKLQLCQKQCNDSAKLGYPCRPNYCTKF